MDMRVQFECPEMGTLRLSALPNQMSWMQFKARGGGACASPEARVNCGNFTG